MDKLMFELLKSLPIAALIYAMKRSCSMYEADPSPENFEKVRFSCFQFQCKLQLDKMGIDEFMKQVDLHHTMNKHFNATN